MAKKPAAAPTKVKPKPEPEVENRKRNTPVREPSRELSRTTSNRVSNKLYASEPPKALQDQMKRDAGQGTSSDVSDNLVPFIRILQDQSPQVLKRNEEYIEGAETGDIWLRNADDPIVKGDEGILFQSCYFFKDIVEWVPRKRGGGFVARHPIDKMPPDAEMIEDEENPNRRVYTRKNGNECVETRYHVGIIHRGEERLPYFVPLASTGHTFSRTWTTAMRRKLGPDGKPAPSYALVYRLFSKQKTNAAGDWFQFDFEFVGWADADDYAAGKALYDGFATQVKDVDMNEGADDRAGADKDAM